MSSHTVCSTSVEPEFLRGPEAARYLSVTYSHLRALVHKGQGPPSAKIGRAVVYPISGLRDFVAARIRESHA